MEDELIAPIPSYIANSLEAFNKLGKLREQQKHKEHELEKALNEIALTQKDEKYQTYLLNTIKQRQEKVTRQRELLEEKKQKALDDIKKAEEELEKKRNHYNKIIERVETDLERIDTAEKEESTSYFVNELARINDSKKSNPKIRALEFDLETIKKEVQTILESVSEQDNEVNKRVEAEERRKRDLLAQRQADIERIQKKMDEQRKNPPKPPAQIAEERLSQNQVYFQPPPQNHQPLFPNIIGDTKKKRTPKTINIE